MNDHFTAPDDKTFSFDRLHTHIQEMLAQAQEIGRVNSLKAFHAQAQLQRALHENWQQFTQEYHSIAAQLQQLPDLPDWEQIQWAQRTLELPEVVFMEIDTTGLDYRDEMVRFTLVNREGIVLEDCLIKPTTRLLSPQASEINGIQPEQLENALPITNAWERIQQALRGRHVISFGLEWDVAQLDSTAARHGLAHILVPGDCLQRHATRYYHREYSLKLAELCTRIGSPLPNHPHQTSLDRARGQLAVLQAFAQAITDVRPPVVLAPKAEHATEPFESDDFDPFLDWNDLP
ncbi:MAG TPA: exonuclease domain-containing protein [Ktedonobacteraceae bacterium]|nr:exonuclease domain-containing protein [Ktedonobacteraceae bacterium]